MVSVSNMVDLFQFSLDVKRINRTYITLVSKTAKSDSINHYRFIRVCNISYKSMSKILANILNSSSYDYLSPTRSVQGREIYAIFLWYMRFSLFFKRMEKKKKNKQIIMAIKHIQEKRMID